MLTQKKKKLKEEKENVEKCIYENGWKKTYKGRAPSLKRVGRLIKLKK